MEGVVREFDFSLFPLFARDVSKGILFDIRPISSPKSGRGRPRIVISAVEMSSLVFFICCK